MLDLGCGANTTLSSFRSSAREVWGTDLDCHPALENREWFRLLNDDGTIPFDDESFDLVTCSWVLEHIRKPRVFLGEVKRVLRPGGLFIAHTINGRHYVAQMNRVVSRLSHGVTQLIVKLLYRRPHHDTHPAFYRLNTRESVGYACRQSGLDLAEVRSYADPFYFQFSKPLMNLAIGLDWLLERQWPGLGRIYLTFTMRKPQPVVRNTIAA